MKKIRVLIVDDHELFRAGVRALLEKLVDFEVVGEAGTGRDALHTLKAQPADVVLMDILMPGLNGLDATARIAAEFPQTRVLILSMNTAEEYVMQSLHAGACGFLIKNVSPTELELAIKAVMRGETYLASAVSKAVIDKYLERTGGNHNTHQSRLTIRQREVLQLIAEGRKTKEIARALDISVKTVELHRSQLMKGLEIHDIAGLVRYAIRIGLISSSS